DSNIEPETVKTLLRFIYTDQEPDFNQVDSAKLISVADKVRFQGFTRITTSPNDLLCSLQFKIIRLRHLCSHDLNSKLSIQSALNTLVVADQHQLTELKAVTRQFVAKF